MARRAWKVFARSGREEDRPVGEIRATVTVGGDVSGQLAVGSNIVQMRVGNVLGNLVNVLPPDARVNVAPRPVPDQPGAAPTGLARRPAV